MSFILQDRNLLNQLLKFAQQGQPLPAPEAGNQTDKLKDVAKKLVDNLMGQIGQTGTFTADRDNADLNMKNLVNLKALLTFIQFNGIRYNNLKLVIPHTKNGAQELIKPRRSRI